MVSLLVGGASLRAGEEVPVDAAQLSGVWNGKRSADGVESCGASGGAKKVRVTLESRTDGSFTAIEARAPDYKVEWGAPWNGKVSPGGLVDVTKPATAICNGEKRQYKVHLVGKAWTDKARVRLRLEGEDGPCPQHRCYLKLKYALEKDQ